MSELKPCLVCGVRRSASALHMCSVCGKSFDRHMPFADGSTHAVMAWAARRARSFERARNKKGRR